MIIDAGVPISPTSRGGNCIVVDELVGRVGRSGIAGTPTWLQSRYVRDKTDQGNAYLTSTLRDHPEHILGFGWVDPSLGRA